MALVFHIIAALSSMAYATYVFFFPSARKFYASYTLIGLTIASGTYLILTRPVHMLQTCETGLAYVSIMTVAVVAAHYRLNAQKATVKSDS